MTANEVLELIEEALKGRDDVLSFARIEGEDTIGVETEDGRFFIAVEPVDGPA